MDGRGGDGNGMVGLSDGVVAGTSMATHAAETTDKARGVLPSRIEAGPLGGLARVPRLSKARCEELEALPYWARSSTEDKWESAKGSSRGESPSRLRAWVVSSQAIANHRGRIWNLAAAGWQKKRKRKGTGSEDQALIHPEAGKDLRKKDRWRSWRSLLVFYAPHDEPGFGFVVGLDLPPCPLLVMGSGKFILS